MRGSVVICANQSWMGLCSWTGNERMAFPKLGLGSSWVGFPYEIAISYNWAIKTLIYNACHNDGSFHCGFSNPGRDIIYVEMHSAK